MNAVGAVLAAGASRRLGKPKQLLQLPDGDTLVRRSARIVGESSVRRSAVVIGANPELVESSLQGLEVDVLCSDDYREGIAGSIRAAAAWASRLGADALLLCVCDQPLLNPGQLNALLGAWVKDQCMVASYYAGKRAVPAVFPSQHFAELQALSGDVGAASLLKAASRITLVGWGEGELDLDTLSDWQRFSNLVK